MYAYLKGMLTKIAPQYVVIDTMGVGYQVYSPNPYSYELNKEIKVYIYQNVKEDEISLYGFKTEAEKEIFIDLISVKGIGPKTAVLILTATTVKEFKEAVVRKDTIYLSKFPKIGKKSAGQIILDLEKKYINLGVEEMKQTELVDEELVDALTSLGYDKKVVLKIIPKINKEQKIEEQIKEGLKLLLKI